MQALFLEQMYINELFKETSKIEMAIDNVKKSLILFGAEENLSGSHSREPSIAGMGLSLFHLGYLYFTYLDALVDLPEVNHYGVREVLQKESIKDKSINYFSQAYEKFRWEGHFMGMHLCRKSQFELTGSKLFQEQSAKDLTSAESSNSKFINRSQGFTYSLLVELTMNNQSNGMTTKRMGTMDTSEP
jgi:hypothetical protein